MNYSPRQVSWWLSQPIEELPSEHVKEYLIFLLELSPELKAVRDLALSFKRLMKDRQVEQLDEWLSQCENGGQDALSQFANGLRQDYAAVEQARPAVAV